MLNDLLLIGGYFITDLITDPFTPLSPKVALRKWDWHISSSG
jgi:hypothetical protein